MNILSLAPCGVICDLCLGFQREKIKCVGCNHTGYKPYHCTVCSKKMCPEKNGDETKLCSECKKYPCRKIKDLDKRYIKNYNVSLIQNFQDIAELGIDAFIEKQKEKWKCKNCGELLCVHKEVCLHCGAKNEHFPEIK